jgi:hypothetical protein
MMVALFHAVPLTIELIWVAVSKYVGHVIANYRYRRSVRIASEQMDENLGVESAMPHILNESTKTPRGKKPTTSERNGTGRG